MYLETDVKTVLSLGIMSRSRGPRVRIQQWRTQKKSKHTDCYTLLVSVPYWQCQNKMSSTAAATMTPDARPKGQQALRLLRDGKSLANMPWAIRSATAFANHYHLAKINKLVSQAGLGTPVYNAVEILHPDNGECFFSEYLVEQRKCDSANMNRLWWKSKQVPVLCLWEKSPHASTTHWNVPQAILQVIQYAN